MLEEPESNRLDQSLRDAFEDYELTPSVPVWQGIEQRLAQLPPPVLPRRPRRLVPLPLLFGLVALLAGLGGWLLPHGTIESKQPVAISAPQVSYNAAHSSSNAQYSNENAKNNGNNAQGTTINAQNTVSNAAYSGINVQNSSSNAAHSIGNAQNNTRNAPYHARIALSNGNNARHSRVVVAGAALSANAVGVPTLTRASKPRQTASEGQPLTTAASSTTTQLPAPAVAAVAIATNQPATPAVLRPLLALETTYAVQAKPSLGEPASRAAIVATLRAERTELLRLQRRADSLLLALGEPLPTAPLAQTDTTQARPDVPKPDAIARRWSLLLTAAPEQNTVTLQGRPDDKLSALRQGHETGRVGFSAALGAEYQATRRLSLGAGLGYTQFGTEFRLTNRRTEVNVTYDTTTSISLEIGNSVHETYSIKLVRVPHLTPVFNGSGQVIDYDTVFTMRPDTTFTTTILTDTLRNVTRTITPLLNEREVVTSHTYKPQYRFLTLPVQLRYRITPPGSSRWWTDVALGAQLQVFLGGTQAVTSDGVNYHTEKITPGGGPFRPVNLALSGSLALNYALTNRLSVSVAPSLRWQALSVYKAETGLRQQSTATGVLLGVRWAL